jgi:ribulose-phosphate 3-epimerase
MPDVRRGRLRLLSAALSTEAHIVKLPPPGTVEIAPSVLSSDFARLADEVAEVEACGVKIIHLDIMDGHFVPNITIGPGIVKCLRKYSKSCFDAHLMITDPEKYAPRFIEAGVDNITFHIETVKDPVRFIETLRAAGVNASITLNPETPVEAVEKVAPLCDMVLVMTVNPGFGAQKLIDSAARKCIRLRQILGPKVRIQVDGGINRDTAGTVVAYGADTLVAGNAIFAQKDRRAAIEAIRTACAKP